MNRDSVIKIRVMIGMTIIIAMIFQYARIAALPIGLMNGTPATIAVPYVLLMGLLIPLVFTMLLSLPALLFLELNQRVTIPTGFRLPIGRIMREVRREGVTHFSKRSRIMVMRC